MFVRIVLAAVGLAALLAVILSTLGPVHNPVPVIIVNQAEQPASSYLLYPHSLHAELQR